MAVNDLILYSTEDGLAQFSLREMNDQVWLTQLELAELYQSSKQNINKHIQAVLAEGELAEAAVVNSKLTTAADGKDYLTQLYALPMIIAIGYRVRSTRGSQFRQWATRTLGEYLQKGFVMDDARLKAPRCPGPVPHAGCPGDPPPDAATDDRYPPTAGSDSFTKFGSLPTGCVHGLC